MAYIFFYYRRYAFKLNAYRLKYGIYGCQINLYLKPFNMPSSCDLILYFSSSLSYLNVASVNLNRRSYSLRSLPVSALWSLQSTSPPPRLPQRMRDGAPGPALRLHSAQTSGRDSRAQTLRFFCPLIAAFSHGSLADSFG